MPTERLREMARMALTDDQIRALMRDTSRQPPAARLLGFELIDFPVEGGWAEVAFTTRPEFANPAGNAQGVSSVRRWTMPCR
jgi:acyl-coenzyme A thioesterase PaaI-like protein